MSTPKNTDSYLGKCAEMMFDLRKAPLELKEVSAGRAGAAIAFVVASIPMGVGFCPPA